MLVDFTEIVSDIVIPTAGAVSMLLIPFLIGYAVKFLAAHTKIHLSEHAASELDTVTQAAVNAELNKLGAGHYSVDIKNQMVADIADHLNATADKAIATLKLNPKAVEDFVEARLPTAELLPAPIVVAPKAP